MLLESRFERFVLRIAGFQDDVGFGLDQLVLVFGADTAASSTASWETSAASTSAGET